jgi:hypothetical protein
LSQETVLCHVFILESEIRNLEITCWFLIENILKDDVHYLRTITICGSDMKEACC